MGTTARIHPNWLSVAYWARIALLARYAPVDVRWAPLAAGTRR